MEQPPLSSRQQEEREGRQGDRRGRGRHREKVRKREIFRVYRSTERKKQRGERPLEERKLCKMGLRRQQIKLLLFDNN